MADRPGESHAAAQEGAAHHGATDAAETETGGYRAALESYADLMVGAADDPAEMRRLERRIADHLVDGAAPEAPTPAPTPPPVADK